MNATLDLHELRERIGGVVYDGGLRWLGPGPNHSRADRSLSVSLVSGRALVHSFTDDPFSECAKHLGLEREAVAKENPLEAMRRRAAAAAFKAQKEAQDLALCKAIWEETSPIAGTPAEAYLWSRGLILDAEDVRFHPAAPRRKPREEIIPGERIFPSLPAMVAKVRANTGRPKALHITYLTPDGRKALGERSRLMFGATAGRAVRLAPVTAEGVLACAEGVETAAAYTALHDLPCWAALSAPGLAAFELPPGLKRLVIAADSDDNGAGKNAALRLAERARRTCDVTIHAAPEGKDWNDVLKEARNG